MTEGYGQPAPSLLQVLAQPNIGRLSAAMAQDSLQRQLDVFEQHAGSPPDFLDGHQHIHQLPGLRQALLKILHDRYGAHAPWVRSNRPTQWGANKATILALPGGYRLQRALNRFSRDHNSHFAGVYGCNAATPEAYGVYMTSVPPGERHRPRRRYQRAAYYRVRLPDLASVWRTLSMLRSGVGAGLERKV